MTKEQAAQVSLPSDNEVSVTRKFNAPPGTSTGMTDRMEAGYHRLDRLLEERAEG